MTPSSPSPDTGAGTPLTAEEMLDRVLAYHHPRGGRCFALDAAASRPVTDPARLSDYQRGYVDGFDAPANVTARSRPATDPAGLDVDALTVRGALAAVRIEVEDHEWADADREFVEHLTRTVERGQRAADRLARLSVADGPGPEDRPDATEEWLPDD